MVIRIERGQPKLGIGEAASDEEKNLCNLTRQERAFISHLFQAGNSGDWKQANSPLVKHAVYSSDSLDQRLGLAGCMDRKKLAAAIEAGIQQKNASLPAYLVQVPSDLAARDFTSSLGGAQIKHTDTFESKQTASWTEVNIAASESAQVNLTNTSERRLTALSMRVNDTVEDMGSASPRGSVRPRRKPRKFVANNTLKASPKLLLLVTWVAASILLLHM